jgi:type II secretory pathway pseudopilin PulG
MYIIPIAWSYVAVMIAATEESLLRGIIALLLWGVLPVGLFMFFAGSPGRRKKRALEQALMDEQRAIESAKLESPAAHPTRPDDDKNSDTKNTQ